MARLFTSKSAPEGSEVILDAPEAENIKSSGNKMTVSAMSKSNKMKKLTGTWIKLLSLPPQELVSELKV